MAEEHIATYLNDHLAGSVVAVELLEHLESVKQGTSLEQFFAKLRADIVTDRQELEELMRQLNIQESRTRKASAWITEKFTQLKLRLDDATDGPLHLLEAVEGLSLGIEGKKSLWRSLAAVAETTPALRMLDYDRLIQRADEQRDRVEAVRLDAARAALTLGS